MTTEALIVLCTVPDEATGERIARALLDETLVACVNIVPGLRSLYLWQGKLEDERELLLVIKTQRPRYAELERRLQELHPYQVCEVLALGVEEAAPAYLAWLLAESASSSR